MTDPAAPLADYYQARAREYEAIYDKPERQRDLAALRIWLAREAAGRTILEIACGTGYWTAVAAASARRIRATDFNSGPLEIARAKALGPHVEFAEADAYDLPAGPDGFDCGMAHHWWSHVTKAGQGRFLGHVASRLAPGARLLMLDNAYVEGSSTPIARSDAAGNTYQMRTLRSGEHHEVLKNFPTRAELEASLAPYCSTVEVLELPYYWAVSATLGPPK